jgi:hypothetical protein
MKIRILEDQMRHHHFVFWGDKIDPHESCDQSLMLGAHACKSRYLAAI